MRLLTNWRLAAKVFPFVILAVIAKIAVHQLGWEMLELNALFSSIIGATVFLIGFMISGTLSDYKESERLPSDLAASLYAIADECTSVELKHGKKATRKCVEATDKVAVAAIKWLRTKGSQKKLLDSIDQLNDGFNSLQPHTEATYINRLKGEQNQIRKLVLRMQTIRETSFIGTAYAIAEVSTILLVSGLVLAKGQPFGESLFFIGFITFVLTYMIALITDLDNPFNYSAVLPGDEVSLHALEQFKKR